MACLSEFALAQGAGGHVVRPSKTGNTRNKPVVEQSAKEVIDGMQYKISGKSATLIKGKDASAVSIPRSVSYKGVSIPVTKIGAKAFSYCWQLVSIAIPNSVNTIGSQAFFCCRNLTSVSIPNGVQIIGEHAFTSCDNLTSITIPSSVKKIGPLSCMNNLKYLKVEKGNTIYDSRDNCNAIIETATNKLIIGSANTIIPHSVKTIGETAFNYNKCLTSIIIPNSVTSIETAAFCGCSEITAITIPSSIRSIGFNAFSSCYGLKKVIVTDIARWCSIKFETSSSNPLSYAQHLYYGDAVVTNLIIPDGVKKIGDFAFAHCEDIVSVTISSSVQTIGKSAFIDCRKLETIVIPKSIKAIGEACFEYCPLKEVKIPIHTRLHTSENGKQDVFPLNTKIVRY